MNRHRGVYILCWLFAISAASTNPTKDDQEKLEVEPKVAGLLTLVGQQTLTGLMALGMIGAVYGGTMFGLDPLSSPSRRVGTHRRRVPHNSPPPVIRPPVPRRAIQLVPNPNGSVRTKRRSSRPRRLSTAYYERRINSMLANARQWYRRNSIAWANQGRQGKRKSVERGHRGHTRQRRRRLRPRRPAARGHRRSTRVSRNFKSKFYPDGTISLRCYFSPQLREC